MKKLLSLLLSLLVTASISADVNIRYSTFPDANFRSWLLEQSYGSDGVLTDAEIAGVTSINVNDKNIKNLKGIEYFTALQYLYCNGNQLTSLDMSGCTALISLDCGGNQLTSLNLSGCSALNYLFCNSNPLTSLNISGCTSLATLFCEGTQLTTLDASDCAAMSLMYCENNQLSSLKLSAGTAIKMELYCYSNYIRGKNMDVLVESLPEVAIGYMYVINNYSSSEEGNVMSTEQVTAANERGWIVYCREESYDWQEYAGSEPELEIDDINFPDENFRKWLLSQNYGTDGFLSDSEIAEIGFINIAGKNIKSLKGIEFFTALEFLHCEDNQLSSLDISKNSELKILDCYNNQLTSLDISKNTELLSLDCKKNLLTSLDISNNTVLFYLDCSSNQVTSLDVSKNTALEFLLCFDNQLTSLDVSNNTKLEHMFLYQNQIKGENMDAFVRSLAVTEFGVIYVIYNEYEGNIMTGAQVKAAESKGWIPYYYAGDYWQEYAGLESGLEIDETNFPDENFRKWLLSQSYGADGVITSSEIADIKSINVSGKNIKSLKGIEFFTALTGLSCYENQLTSLDVSKNIYLTGLFCDGNQLISLDVSKNTELTKFECCDNQLTSLDVSNNPALKYLDCSNNKLTSLDVSKSTALEYLYCCYNQISGKNMDLLVNSLPIVNGDKEGCLVVIYDGNEGDDVNVITDRQVAAAKRKGWMSYSIDDNEDLHEYPGVQTYVPGDVNGDDIVNGTDIQAVINFIVASEYDEKADINEDGKVNGTDIQEIINIIVNAQ